MTPYKITLACGHKLINRPSCRGDHPCGPWCWRIAGDSTVALQWGRYASAVWSQYITGKDGTKDAINDLYAALLAERGYMPRDAE